MKHLVIAIAALLLIAATGALGQKATAPTRPNVLLVVADDLGWRDLGCFGSSFYETPNIDALAARGMKFTSSYTAPVCSPTRASLMTGRYPQRVGVTDYISRREGGGPYQRKRNGFLTPMCNDRLELSERTVAEAFGEAGYATFFAGKWHLGPEGFWPENQGFDVNKGGWTAGNPSTGNKYFSPYKNPRLSDGPAGEHLDERLARETVAWIEKNRSSGKPFFAELAFYSPHVPLMSRQELIEKYKKKAERLGISEAQFGKEGESKVRLNQSHAVYAAMIETMDRALGTVMDALAQMKLADDTIVIFTSDNGGVSTSEGWPTSNLPLRAGKGWLYEGGVRVPSIVVWPGKVKAQSVCEQPVSATDWYPTMLAMAGLELRPKEHVDGVSVMPMLRGERFERGRGAIYWHYPHFANQGGFAGGAMREGDFKLVQNFVTQKVELFDLSKDIGETMDLAETMAEKTSAMLKSLKDWQTSVKAQFPTKLAKE